MQATKSPPQKTPICRASSCVSFGSASVHAITHSRGREHGEERVAPVPALAVEAEDEREEIDRERGEPQQRHGGDVLRDVVGHGEQQERPGRGQNAPQDLAPDGRRWLLRDSALASCRLVGGRDDRGSCGVFQARPAGGGAETDEERIGDRPADRLRARRGPRLQQERIADECQHRREIRQREQPVRTRAGPRAREPDLDQRARRRQQEVRQPDGRREHAQDQPRRALAAGRLPVGAGNDRQQGDGRDEQHRVQLDLRARAEPAHDIVGIGVAGEQRRLKEDEARGPDRGRAAEPRQDLLRDHRLHQEQQERADENGGGVEGHRGPVRNSRSRRERAAGNRAFYRTSGGGRPLTRGPSPRAVPAAPSPFSTSSSGGNTRRGRSSGRQAP